MFEQAFRQSLPDPQQANALWGEIVQAYGEAHRHYHTLAHLDQLLTVLNPVREKIQDWPIMLMAIAYHDIIYIPGNTDNEAQSASVARARLDGLGFTKEQCDHASKMIEATQSHGITHDNDSNYFIDADLAILGAPRAQYLEYADQVRKEYSTLSDVAFLAGRKKVLQHFRDMPTIYKTAYFAEAFEAQARINIAAEINKYQ